MRSVVYLTTRLITADGARNTEIGNVKMYTMIVDSCTESEQAASGSRSVAETVNETADSLGCPKGPLHWVAFQYARDRPMMEFCGSMVNSDVIDTWTTLPWNCYIVLTRGPLDAYKPKTSSIRCDLQALACALQPPFVTLPEEFAALKPSCDAVLFHNRIYQRSQVFPESQ